MHIHIHAHMRTKMHLFLPPSFQLSLLHSESSPPPPCKRRQQKYRNSTTDPKPQWQVPLLVKSQEASKKEALDKVLARQEKLLEQQELQRQAGVKGGHTKLLVQLQMAHRDERRALELQVKQATKEWQEVRCQP
jgi:hypothetical protein